MKTKILEVRGASFHVLDTDDCDAGSVLVMLHGFPLSHMMWQRQVELAATTGSRMILPDLRGHGGSSVTEGKVTMQTMSDDVVAILDQLEVQQPVFVCGLSMGGYVAWEIWRQYPGRLGKLILCDTRAVADPPEVARARQIMADHVLREGAGLAEKSMLPKLFADTTHERQPTLVEEVRQAILATDPRAIAATQRGMAERVDMMPQLGQIDLPTLVVCGEHDQISPPTEMAGIAAAMPAATFVEIADAGHLAPLENPVAFNAAVRQFLVQ